MSDAPKPSNSRAGGNDSAWALLALGAAALLVAIPALAGAAMWWLTRGRLRRGEYWLALATSLAGLAIAGEVLLGRYLSWLWVLVSGDGNRWSIPVLSIALLGVGVGAVAGLLEGTRIGAKIPGGMFGKADDPFHHESIIPDEHKRQRVKTVTPPDGLLVAADDNSIEGGSEFGKRAFPIGYDANGTPFMITEDEFRMHCLLFGSTGSGKSKTIEAIAGGLLDLGWEGLIIDLKEDTDTGGLRDWCAAYTAAHAKPYQQLCLSDPDPDFWFNPLAGIGPDEARDSILSLSEFEAPYWRAINENMLGQLTSLMYWAHEADPNKFEYPNLIDMGRILSAPSLENAVKRYVAVVTSTIPGVTKDDFRSLLSPSKDEMSSAPGFGARLTSMYATQAGRTVLRPSETRKTIDVTRDGLTYIGLDSQGKPDLSRVISSAMLQRLSVYASQRTTGRSGGGKAKPRFLIVDEANWVDRTIVQNLLSRARGAGISMVLATQGPRDWIDNQGDDFAKLGQNTNVAIIMAQGEPESAEICADYIGKEERLDISRRVVDGDMYDMGSTRKETVHRVTPDQLRSLEIGEAVVRVGKPKERFSWVAVKIRDPRAVPHGQPTAIGQRRGPFGGAGPNSPRPPV